MSITINGPVKEKVVDAPVTGRTIIDNHVVFVVDKQVKSYNDIETIKNINSVTFKKVTKINVFGFIIGDEIEKK